MREYTFSDGGDVDVMLTLTLTEGTEDTEQASNTESRRYGVHKSLNA